MRPGRLVSPLHGPNLRHLRRQALSAPGAALDPVRTSRGALPLDGTLNHADQAFRLATDPAGGASTPPPAHHAGCGRTEPRLVQDADGSRPTCGDHPGDAQTPAVA